MPIDEDEEHFISNCRKNNLSNIQVISPASTDERLKKNAAVANGFIYCIAHQGITGARSKLDLTISVYLKKVKKFFSIPIAVGFGISRREHLEKLKPYADIAIVGSAIVDVIDKSNSENMENDIKGFLSSLKI